MTTKPVDARLMYLAGLFEGEGCANISKCKASKCKMGYRHQARLLVSMTDIEPVRALRDYFGNVIYVEKQNEVTRGRTKYVWKVTNRDAGKVAKVLMPHILISRKRSALQCVIDFAATIIISGRPLSPFIWHKREDLYMKCKAFNAKGIDANNRDEADLEAIEAIKTATAQMLLWA